MPVVNGVNAAIAMRAIEKGYDLKKPIPILFFTAKQCDETFKKVLSYTTPAKYINKGTGTSPDPLTAWQASSGFGGSSQLSDPGFAGAAAGDLRSGSAAAAMIDAGHPSLSAPDTVDGCPRDVSPDSGTHEWGVVFCDSFEHGDTTYWSATAR